MKEYEIKVIVVGEDSRGECERFELSDKQRVVGVKKRSYGTLGNEYDITIVEEIDR